MKVLIDMNLSPQWVGVLKQHGFNAVHWSEVGDIRAKDRTIMQWAREHEFVVFTHDLDFGVMLALTRSVGPSVLQIRTQDPLPSSRLERIIVTTLKEHVQSLERGALVSVDEVASRIRILPIIT